MQTDFGMNVGGVSKTVPTFNTLTFYLSLVSAYTGAICVIFAFQKCRSLYGNTHVRNSGIVDVTGCDDDRYELDRYEFSKFDMTRNRAYINQMPA